MDTKPLRRTGAGRRWAAENWRKRFGDAGLNWRGEKVITNSRVRSEHPQVPDDIHESLWAIENLVRLDDPYARVRAMEIAEHIRSQVSLPDDAWVVFSIYLPRRDGTRFGAAGHHAVWSAHVSEEEAAKWHAAWVEKWSRQRTDYWTMYAQMPGIAPHYLRHEGMSLDEIKRAVNW